MIFEKDFLKYFFTKGYFFEIKKLFKYFKNRAHIYDSVRFNLNIASKNGIRKQSDEKENIEGFMSSNSPIILHFKEDKDNRNFTNDEKNLNNNIRIHNTIPNYCNSKDFKTGKIDKYQNQKNINFENFKKTFNK